MQTMNLSELESLRRMKLKISRSISTGEGQRRSGKKGRSAEFSGYREYIPGDDMRYIDWNAYARFDKLYIKEFMEEREGKVSIYLDTSRSMEFGEKLKSTLMSELTEAISYAAISARDAVSVTDLGSGRTLRVPSGNQGMSYLRNFLEKIEPSGRVNILEAMKRVKPQRGGAAFLISDFMDEAFLGGEDELLRLFGFYNSRLTLLHVLSGEELNVDDVGAFQLIDSEEEDKSLHLTIDRITVDSYKKRLNAYMKELKTKAEKQGAAYILCRTDKPLKAVLYEDMRGIYDI